MSNTKTKKPRMKFTAFLKKYGRILIGGTIIAAVILCTVFAPLLTDYDPEEVGDYSEFKQPPSEEHWLGTDIYGRDMWSRIVFGGRSTLLVSRAHRWLWLFWVPSWACSAATIARWKSM